MKRFVLLLIFILPISGALACPQSGSYPNQSVFVKGKERRYFVYYPNNIKCDSSSALWLDFHGVAGLGNGFTPETTFSQRDFVEIAEKNNAILIRFRGVPRPRTKIYAWDYEVDQSLSMINQVVGQLKKEKAYNIRKVFAFGFSNGTNFAFNLIKKSLIVPLAGVANFAGGPFIPFQMSSPMSSSFRYYASGGVRDSMSRFTTNAVNTLIKARLPRDQISIVEHQGSHNISRHFLAQAVSFLTRGSRVDDSLDFDGAKLVSLPSEGLVTSLAQTPKFQFALTSHGEMFRRSKTTNSSWVLLGQLPKIHGWSRAMTDICFLKGGKKGVAVSLGKYFSSKDGGETWTQGSISTPNSNQPTAIVNKLHCSSSKVFMASYQGIYESSDLSSWRELKNTPGQRLSPWTFAYSALSDLLLISGSYDYRGVFWKKVIRPISQEVPRTMFNDTIYFNGKWYQVGDRGKFATADEMLGGFKQSQIAASDVDFFTIAVSGAGRIAVGGTRGFLATSQNGGKSFSLIPGVGGGSISKLLWLDETRLAVAGSKGQVLHVRIDK